MKGILNIENTLDDYFKYSFGVSKGTFDYEININASLNDKFFNIISDSHDLKDSIEFVKSNFANIEELSIIKKCEKNIDSLLKDAEYVCLDFDMKMVAKYIEQNPILKTKKIVLNHIKGYDEKIISEIRQHFEDTSYIYLLVDNDSNPVSFEDYQKATFKIDNIVRTTNTLNFSPLEKAMFVYDIVREKIYTEENPDDYAYSSRDVSSCLLGDKIVCLGYSNIYNTIMNKLGIKSNNFIINKAGSNDRHARSELYLNDEKYGINGIYYFDPTWDSKLCLDDTSYLQNYSHFAMTRPFMEKVDRKAFTYPSMPLYYPNMASDFNLTAEFFGIENIPKGLKRSINYMLFFSNDAESYQVYKDINLRHKYDELYYNKIIELVKMYNKPISSDILSTVLYNVRKMEYYMNPDSFPYTAEDFAETINESGWILPQNESIENNEDMKLDIERIRLTRTLKKVHNKKAQ